MRMLPVALLGGLLLIAMPVLAESLDQVQGQATTTAEERKDDARESLADAEAEKERLREEATAYEQTLLAEIRQTVHAAQAEAAALQQSGEQTIGDAQEQALGTAQTVEATAEETGATAYDAIKRTAEDAENALASGGVLPEDSAEGDGADGATDEGEVTLPTLSTRIRDAIEDEVAMASMVSSATAGATALAFAVVTRYISPKEALKNPQRAMLYGFVRAQPGAHLKQVADEFQMKTSSILWHMRKLESAGLVQSERANGFRVFYPVEGGIEIKRVSRALTALQNGNALAIFEVVDNHPGQTTRILSDRLGIHVGTVRWHLRKLREFGLVDELVREDGSMFYPTPLGGKALEAAMGRPTMEVPTTSKRAPVAAEGA